MIDETLFEAEEKMDKAVSVLRDDLATIRTGRATPQMFAKIVVDYYGAATPLRARLRAPSAPRSARRSRRRARPPTAACRRW